MWSTDMRRADQADQTMASLPPQRYIEAPQKDAVAMPTAALAPRQPSCIRYVDTPRTARCPQKIDTAF